MSKKSRFPDSLVLIVLFIVVAQLLSYVVPKGAFEREKINPDSERTKVVAGTYAPVEDAAALSPWHGFVAVSEGFEKAQDIIFLVFLVGGVIAILRATGAIDAGLQALVKRLGKAPALLIGGTMLVFSFGSYTIGMGEEYVALIPIIVSMSLAMKMDAIVAMGMVWVPYGIGWACAGFNPFGVKIAQSLAGVPDSSGWQHRIVMMLVFLAVAFHHIMRYAKKVQADPSKSLVADVDYSDGFEPAPGLTFDVQKALVLTLLFGGIGVFIWGAKAHGWYITELNAVFLGIGVLAAIIAQMSPNETSRAFIKGAAEMTSAALLIGFARTIEVVLEQGQILDTIVHGIASALEGAGAEVSALGMLLVQTVCNFFVPSGSGQAYVTMPIMSPVATLTGVPQQTAVLAYQFGDGFTNMVVPTSALVMGTLSLAKIPYGAWCRFILPLLAKIFIVAAAFLILSVHFGESLRFNG